MSAKLRRRLFKYLPLFKYFLFLVLAGGIFFSLFKFSGQIFRFYKNLFFKQTFVWSMIFKSKPSLKQIEGRTNVLVLGIAGGNHEGATLTDTIIFTSIDLKTNKMVMVSLPRDIWIPSLKEKINTAYSLGEEKRKGGGLILAKAVVSEILGQPIHYALRIDFVGFTKAIDLLGGVDIEVEKSFDDYQYPLVGKENDECEGEDPEYKCRFEHLHFEKGQQHMNGEQALKYARSRHAQGEEGTDFARARRQQKLILAVKKKAFSFQTLLNPPKISQLTQTFGESLETDVGRGEIDDFLRLAPKINSAKIKNVVLDTGDEKTGRVGFLIVPPTFEYGAWVLVPKSGNWKEVQEYVASFMAN